MLEDEVELSRVERRMSGALLTAIGFLAAGIALVGVFGLTSHAVHRRHREFGVLIALGATNRALFLDLATETSRTLARGALFGIAASVPGAFMLRRYVGICSRSTGSRSPLCRFCCSWRASRLLFCR